ncbi:MAG: AGE family epimerase/isomerase [Defluviitaleaceae bacterium]|nr:AGE family epimerase/isomerase [Defluviitaleaceae bacterium]
MGTDKLLVFAHKDLGDLLGWWITHTPDESNGGFYGVVRGDNTPNEAADRFIVVNARLVWTFSAAYHLTKNDEYKKYADRAYDYLTRFFYDKKHGGFYTYVDYKGAAANDRKMTYGNVFAVYGLSEYARVFGCETAKKLATETAAHLDTHMWDAQYKGYFEVASRDWQYMPNILMIQYEPESQKTMNTHLHILEAYANLLRIDGDNKLLRHRVRTLLYLFLNKIINNDNWHFNYFQKRDWTLTNPNYSLGHDIEGSWLLYEAAEILGEPEALADTKRVCANMARAVYDMGISPEGGIYTEYDVHERTYSEQFSWWEQNEGVVGFLHAYEMTGERKFLDASLAALDFIEKYFIDRKHGGWHAYVNRGLTPDTARDKCNPYICPYHNARMSMEIIRRLEKC